MNKVLILGCGPSLSLINETNLPNILTLVGVNDCAKCGIIPDYLLVVDNDFTNERRKIIDSCKDKSILLSHIIECFDFKTKIKLELGDFETLNNIDSGSKIDYSRTSTYMAIIWAYKYLKTTNIGILGLDFTNNYSVDLEMSRNHYGNLCKTLAERNVKLYNLSNISLIDTIPFMNLKEWLNS